MLKRILLTILVVFMMIGIAYADLYLAVDKVVGYASVVVEVEVNGTVVPGILVVADDYVKILDVTGFASDNYVFKARWHDGSGFWSEWSDPFTAGRAGAPGNARVIEE